MKATGDHCPHMPTLCPHRWKRPPPNDQSSVPNDQSLVSNVRRGPPNVRSPAANVRSCHLLRMRCMLGIIFLAGDWTAGGSSHYVGGSCHYVGSFPCYVGGSPSVVPEYHRAVNESYYQDRTVLHHRMYAVWLVDPRS